MNPKTLAAASILAVALCAAPAIAQEDPPTDEGGETVTVKEKKVAYTFSYVVRTQAEVKAGAKRSAAKPSKPSKPSKKDKSAAPAPPGQDAKPAGPPKPAVSLELKGGKLVVTRANIMVNRTVDLGVTMEVFTNEVRLSEFVKTNRAGIGTEFDMIDVVSTLGGLDPGEYSLVYFDMDGSEAFNGKFAVK